MRLIWIVLCLLFCVFACPDYCFAFRFQPGARGYDISFPQCNGSYPQRPYAFMIVGVTGGKAFTQNPCLTGEFFFATRIGATPSTYMNLNFPSGATVDFGKTGPFGTCRKSDMVCQSYNYGYNAAENAYRYASSQLVHSHVWWLDIELANTWSDNVNLNRRVIEGAIVFFSSVSVVVGVYSIPSNWGTIMGASFTPFQRILFPLPNWVVGDGDSLTASDYCLSPFTQAGNVKIVQNTSGEFDEDYVCP